MAISEIYVDPSIAADSGTGTIGDPFGDLEYAIEQTTFDTTNGTRVNIKAGTDEVLVANLSVAMADTSVAAAWASGLGERAVFQGYTTTAGDGGVGGISGGGSVPIIAGTLVGVTFKDLHLHNFGGTFGVKLGTWGVVDNCEVDNGTAGGISISGIVSNCTVHNVGYIGVWMSGGVVRNNFIYSDGRPFQFNAIYCTSAATVQRNIVLLEEAADDQDGIGLAINSLCDNNSIWSNVGTGMGINQLFANTSLLSVSNNVVSGFSGTGGYGIKLDNGNTIVNSTTGNSIYNCATDFAGAALDSMLSVAPYETLAAEPFTDPANGDFSPVDTGSIKQGGLPQLIGSS